MLSIQHDICDLAFVSVLKLLADTFGELGEQNLSQD